MVKLIQYLTSYVEHSIYVYKFENLMNNVKQICIPLLFQTDSTLRNLLAILLFLLPLQLTAQELGDRIREHVAETDFHGVILVEHQGEILFHEPFGLAHRSFQAPITTDTKFSIASITKLFTSTLVLQFVDEGLLDLEDTIGAYLPEYEGEAKTRVTIHQLLNHTSGLENYEPSLPLDEILAQGLEVYQLPHTTDELVSEHASGSLEAEPGTRFSYNNADFVLLGKILEQIANKSFDEILHERILEPLGMGTSGMLTYDTIIPKLASSYVRFHADGLLQNEIPLYKENWVAAGAMYATGEDLLRFSNALFDKKLLSESLLDRLLTPGLDEHGYGAWIASTDIGETSRTFLHRPGRIMGTNTLLLHYLDEDLTIIILGNTNNTDTDEFGFQIGRWVLEYE